MESGQTGTPAVAATAESHLTDVFFAPLAQHLAEYLDAVDIARIRTAFEFGAQAHAGQTRKSGEPYISHPIAVAHILADLRMDEATLVAAILHDVVEDTDIVHVR